MKCTTSWRTYHLLFFSSRRISTEEYRQKDKKDKAVDKDGGDEGRYQQAFRSLRLTFRVVITVHLSEHIYLRRCPSVEKTMPDSKTVLLVEDEGVIAMAEKGVLQKHGFHVLTAS